MIRYTRVETRRHNVRPGITGWAQINGRNAVDWDARLALDVWYVDHVSFRLDLAILARTIGEVLRRTNVNQPGQATMSPLRPHLERSLQTEVDGSADGVVVLGAGGHAKVVVATLQAAGYGIAAVLDDDPDVWGKLLLGVPDQRTDQPHRICPPLSSRHRHRRQSRSPPHRGALAGNRLAPSGPSVGSGPRIRFDWTWIGGACRRGRAAGRPHRFARCH